MNWHLHVTVQPHWSWTLSDVASALARDVERHGVKPVVITNHFRDPLRQPYKELIPTQHFEGDEADASRRIFNLGVLLNNAGWRVRRLKIEGDPVHDAVRHRALYFETHLKNLPHPLNAPRSTNARGDTFHTIRRQFMRQFMTDVDDVVDHLRDMDQLPSDPALGPYYKIEAAVLDTNPALDADWINE